MAPNFAIDWGHHLVVVDHGMWMGNDGDVNGNLCIRNMVILNGIFIRFEWDLLDVNGMLKDLNGTLVNRNGDTMGSWDSFIQPTNMVIELD